MFLWYKGVVVSLNCLCCGIAIPSAILGRTVERAIQADKLLKRFSALAFWVINPFGAVVFGECFPHYLLCLSLNLQSQNGRVFQPVGNPSSAGFIWGYFAKRPLRSFFHVSAGSISFSSATRTSALA